MKNKHFSPSISLDSIVDDGKNHMVSVCQRFFSFNLIRFYFIYTISYGLNRIQTDKITKASFKLMGWDALRRKRMKKT